MGSASAVGRASDVAVEWEGLVLTWHGKGEWEGRRRRHPKKTNAIVNYQRGSSGA